jgi:hypothetical protein
VLIFITSLRHPQNASSWDHVLDLLDRTLRSVCNQTAPDFKVIVVHNESSCLRSHSPGVIYHAVDLPPNPFYDHGSGTEAGRNAFRWDRGQKYLAGLYRAREFTDTLARPYIMFIDADDCVSAHLTEFVNRSSQPDGWYLDQGFLYQEGDRSAYHLPANFSLICGTSHIIRYDHFRLPNEMSAVDRDYILRALGSHVYIREMLAESGILLKPLPFTGAVYMMHDDNHSRIHKYQTLIENYDKGRRAFRTLRMLTRFRPLTKSLRREFGLYPLQRTGHDQN